MHKPHDIIKPWLQEGHREKRGDLETTQPWAVREGKQQEVLNNPFLHPSSLSLSRRTGVELKDTGVRDENGMEPIPSFSSPAKPAMQSSGTSHDVTDSVDDSMDIVESKASA